MTRRPARCTQADIARAINAAKQTGVSMAVETLPDGTIRLTPHHHNGPAAIAPSKQDTLAAAGPVLKRGPRRDPTTGCRVGMIYFIRAKDSGRIKIGFSEHPAERLRGIITGCPEPVELMGSVPGNMDDEKTLHRRFAELRIVGEWFHGAPALLAYIRSVIAVTA